MEVELMGMMYGAARMIGNLACKPVIGKKVVDTYLKYEPELFKSLNSKIDKPTNHDIVKAVRNSHLKSSLAACHFISKKYNLYDQITSQSPTDLGSVVRYLKNQIEQLSDPDFDIVRYRNAKYANIISPPTGAKALEVNRGLAKQQKELMVEELRSTRLNYVERDLLDAILNGWIEEKNNIDWYDLSCAYFIEELKTKDRAYRKIQLEYLTKINDGVNAFNKNTERIVSSHEQLVSSFLMISDKLELLVTHLNRIELSVDKTKEIVTDSKTKLENVQQTVEEFRDKTLEYLQQIATITPHNHTLLNVDSLYDINTDSKSIGLDVVKVANLHAKNLYESKVLQNVDRSFRENVWIDVFNDNDFQAQREYVEVIAKDNQEVRYSTLQALEEGKRRIWIIGEAGVGKTTTLYNIYFSILLMGTDGPIPLLIQPQEFDTKDINIFKNTNNVIKSLIFIWLQKRSILNTLQDTSDYDSISDERAKRIIQQIESGLRSGKIVILIDSFDELSRMSFQIEVFKEIFKISKSYICASRPETYLQNIHQHTHIKIRSPWTLPTIQIYIDNKTDFPKIWKPIIYNFIRQNELIEWLKNPRYLNLIIDLIRHNYNNSTNKFGKKEIISFLSNGEYTLFDKIFDASLERIERLLRSNKQRVDKIKVESMLTKIATSQLEAGNYLLLDSEKKENKLYWQAIITESSLVRRKYKSSDGSGEYISLLNHNLVDYYISDDIANQILDTQKSTNPIGSKQLWTKNLLKYISQYLWRKCLSNSVTYNEVIDRLWTKIQDQKLNHRDSKSTFRKTIRYGTDIKRQFATINLVQLLIQFELDGLIANTKPRKGNNFRTLIKFEYRTIFSDLDLSNVDFSDITFENCDFSRSILYRTNLKNCYFENCNFTGSNLIQANGEGVTFEGCKFDFTKESSRSPVEKFKVKGISLKYNTVVESHGNLDLETLLTHGAIDSGSRYASKFGQDFLKNQKKYLGKGLNKAENYYMNEAIRPSLENLYSGSPKSVLLIDLMAGGNNDRLKSLFGSFPEMSILAIDKHTEQLKSIQTEIGERFKVVKRTISGNIDLQNIISKSFNKNEEFSKASQGLITLRNTSDIIIGKKAIHEIKRGKQKSLLADCYNTIKPGGKLILFTDSPISITNSGYTKLSKLKSYVQKEHNIKAIRKNLIDDLEFEDTNNDVAIFSNLWVLLKDWANENKSEVKNRYFSSAKEIIKWGEKIGFQVDKKPHKEHYDLTAKFFNEYAFNQIQLLLERAQGKSLTISDKRHIYEYLEGTDKHKVFFDFTRKHLFQDAESEIPTPFGKFIGAKRVTLDTKFRALNPQLDGLELPYTTGVSYQFSVHIIEFTKPKPDSTQIGS